MLQNETVETHKPSKKTWRLAGPPPYDVDYLMRFGGIGRQVALALIAEHGADRSAINAELTTMRRRRR
jgi:hypothetical protein